MYQTPITNKQRWALHALVDILDGLMSDMRRKRSERREEKVYYKMKCASAGCKRDQKDDNTLCRQHAKRNRAYGRKARRRQVELKLCRRCGCKETPLPGLTMCKMHRLINRQAVARCAERRRARKVQCR